jgi:hypothetical protein
MKRDNFWFPFEINRWLSNQKLRLVSLSAKGLWIDLICQAYNANAGGRLVINKTPPTEEQLWLLIGRNASKELAELESAGIVTRKEGAIYHEAIEKGLIKMNKKARGYASRSNHKHYKDEVSQVHLCLKDDASIEENKSKSNNKSNSNSNNESKNKEREGLRPTHAEWIAFAKEIGWRQTDAESAFDYYQSNGWKVGGKAAVKDWRACARNCQRRNQNQKKGGDLMSISSLEFAGMKKVKI